MSSGVLSKDMLKPSLCAPGIDQVRIERGNPRAAEVPGHEKLDYVRHAHLKVGQVLRHLPRVSFGEGQAHDVGNDQPSQAMDASEAWIHKCLAEHMGYR